MQASHWLDDRRSGTGRRICRFHDRKVNEVITPNLVTVAATSSLGEACRLIEDRGIKRLPVVQDVELIGIIARADLVRALAQDIERATAATRDISVEERLRELERQNLRNRARTRTSKPY